LWGGLETSRHVLIYCAKEFQRKEELRSTRGGSLDFRKLLDTPDGAGVASRWIVRSGRLYQFPLARVLLYEQALFRATRFNWRRVIR
jgi:hypothetical protein